MMSNSVWQKAGIAERRIQPIVWLSDFMVHFMDDRSALKYCNKICPIGHP